MAKSSQLCAPDLGAGQRPVGHQVPVWRRFARNRLAVLGLVILMLMVALAVAAPLVAPYEPNAVSYDFMAGPSRGHPLGTDDVGRDELSRLIFAARISLTVGISVSVMTVIIGTVIGALAGYYGARVDSWICGGINVLLSIPMIPLAMVLGAFLRKDLIFVVLILGFLSWTGTARIIRAEFLSLKEREFTLAARLIGASDWRIIVQHILPNTVAPIIVAATLQVAAAILAESALSYLGYGIQPPTASWGNMLQNAQRFFRTHPMLAIYPGVLISLTVISINFVGDGLRDALDPRLRTM
ncbi:MAG: ABC transporter permease [Chloroflexi bacterium]|nr:ABC transporter permease [Chloroflexota bacterium]